MPVDKHHPSSVAMWFGLPRFRMWPSNMFEYPKYRKKCWARTKIWTNHQSSHPITNQSTCRCISCNLMALHFNKWFPQLDDDSKEMMAVAWNMTTQNYMILCRCLRAQDYPTGSWPLTLWMWQCHTIATSHWQCWDFGGYLSGMICTVSA